MTPTPQLAPKAVVLLSGGLDSATTLALAREQGYHLGLDYALTISCYMADAQGRACGVCDACQLRAQGFREAGMADPTRYR